MFLLGTLAALPTLPALLGDHTARAQTAPLVSWKDGPAKQAFLDFVKATTDRASAAYVPPKDRIATFDQDGTLWVEHPLYTQAFSRWTAFMKWHRSIPSGSHKSMKNDWKRIFAFEG